MNIKRIVFASLFCIAVLLCAGKKAEASSILLLLSKDIFWTSMPAVCIGTLGAWYLGALWTDQFSETAEFPIYYYILIAFVSLLFIIGCVVIKTWRIANDNPVNSIKSE